MPHPTAPHGDERLPSRMTQRAAGVPDDDRTASPARPASIPEPPRGVEPGDASLSLPIGASFDAGQAWQAWQARGFGNDGGCGDSRAARPDGSTLDGPTGL